MDGIVKDFLQESRENLDRLDPELVQLESDPGNRELLGSIFRTIHTIKGTCGFLGFTKLETITHAGENLLSLLRDGVLELTQEIADGLLEMVDAIRTILQQIEETEAEGSGEYGELVERLKKLQGAAKRESAAVKSGDASREQKGKTAASSKEPMEATPAPEEKPTGPTTAGEASASGPSKGEQGKVQGAQKEVPEVVPKRLGGALVRRGRVKPEDVMHALQMQKDGDTRRIGEILVSLGVVTKQQVEEALQDTQQAEQAAGTIRVDVNLLEKQMNLVSELVLVRNRLLQIAGKANERDLNTTVHGLNFITSELRKNVMKTRMQPISQLFEKFPRLVRDVSKDLGKKVKLETRGGDTELDKTLLEAIKDPVTHILRNSLDHGVEVPQKRRECGKSEEGTVRMYAYHEGGNFHLDVMDDGAGIDAERVKEKAIAKGLVSKAQAEKMSETEIQNFVFAAGLSTAEKVTNVSGRGVGMDVVKTNIERIGGRVKLESVKGQGATVQLEIPLTLATIPALMVVGGKSVFAIPQAALVEMIFLEGENAAKHIERIDGTLVFRFRGSVCPLLSICDELKLSATAAESDDSVHLVVVRAEGRQFAIRVDAIRNTEEIVIKPLSKRLKDIGLYTGATVLGDGRVALILDIPALARRAGVNIKRETRAEEAAQAQRRERMTLLLLAGPDGERMAIPLSSVQRLEEFDITAKERMAGHEVVQYRKEILLVIPLEGLLDERRSAPRTPEGLHPPAGNGRFSAIVVRMNNAQDLLLEVRRILGIVKTDVEKLSPASRAGVKGSLVVQERVTELLDLEFLLSRARLGQYGAPVLVGAGPENRNG